jgi:hypothetical protein
MWEFLAKQLLRQAGTRIGGKFFNDEANGPEAYADRIKRDFHMHDYADAWALYASDPAYWEKYYRPLPDPDAKGMMVQDSAASAGVPSRNNVFEYGFPASNPTQPSIGGGPAAQPAPPTGHDMNGYQPSRSVFDTGAPAIPYLPPASQNIMGGIPGMMEEAGLFDSLNPDQSAPGGLLGLLQEWMRNNPQDGEANR